MMIAKVSLHCILVIIKLSFFFICNLFKVDHYLKLTSTIYEKLQNVHTQLKIV